MESRIGILLLSVVGLSCSGCALFHRHHNTTPAPVQPSPDADSTGTPPSVIEPTVERRTVSVPRIRASNVELGGYYGVLSIQDFGAQPVKVLRADYHVTEDFYFEAAYGTATGGRTSFETLAGNVQLLSNDERRFTYYNVSLGYNFLPGEVFIGRHLAMTSALYLI